MDTTLSLNYHHLHLENSLWIWHHYTSQRIGDANKLRMRYMIFRWHMLAFFINVQLYLGQVVCISPQIFLPHGGLFDVQGSIVLPAYARAVCPRRLPGIARCA